MPTVPSDMPLPPGDRLRLFIALELPDAVAGELRRSVESFREATSFRWIRPANYHVTVRFLGSAEEARLDELTAALSKAAERTAVFRTRITGFGSFPSGEGSARVLWAGLEDGSGSIAGLGREVVARLPGWFPAHPVTYTPHVTLARCDPPRKVPQGWLTARVPAEPFGVGALTLFESRFGADGPAYERLQRFPFRG